LIEQIDGLFTVSAVVARIALQLIDDRFDALAIGAQGPVAARKYRGSFLEPRARSLIRV